MNEVGSGLQSRSVRIVAAVVPDPPSVLQIVSQSSSSVTVGWLAVTGNATGGSPIKSYQIMWKSASDTTYTSAGFTSSSSLQKTKEVSSPGTVYNFKVIAISDAGRSQESYVLSIKSADSPSTMITPILIFANET